MSKPLRGVNLGGWLVLEKWITPSLFAGTDAADEYGFCELADAAQFDGLSHFRDTFITHADFAWLAAHNIDAVRLPVGYWLFGDVHPYAATVQYVDQAFVWAQSHNLQIFISLHGAPGSQNGQLHSGRAGRMDWLKTENQEQTITILERIAKRYHKQAAFGGISLVNEPLKTIAASQLEDFYERAYNRLRPMCRPENWLLFSDGFRAANWRRRLVQASHPGLIMDYHHYQLSSLKDQRLPASMQLLRARWLLPFKLHRIATTHPLVIGEWSAVLTNGAFGRATAEQRNIISRRYAQAQLGAFQSAEAWFYWTYKTERPGLWDYRYCVTHKIIA